MAVFSLRNVVRSYRAGGTEFRLSLPRLDIERGARLGFIGESGSGKSTLLEMLAMILRPDSSELFAFTPLQGGDTFDVAAAWGTGENDRLSDIRRQHIGYVLQHGGLLPYLNVRENIELSCRLSGHTVSGVARHWADRLNIAGQLDKLPAALSVGQRQRVAIARALAHEPAVLIADEPTAAVDPVNAQRILELMVGLVDDMGVTLIVASHAHRLMRQTGLRLIDFNIDAADPHAMHVSVTDEAV